jgi:hypothetical protein
VLQRRGINGGRGEEQAAHHVLRHEPRQVRRCAKGASFHLGQPEGGVVRGDNDVGVADQTDAAAHAEAVDGGDHGHRAFIDRAERRIAATVGVDERGEALGFLHLLDVDARVEAPALRAQDHHVCLGIFARLGDRVGEFEPAG